jgi:hypothetical protein
MRNPVGLDIESDFLHLAERTTEKCIKYFSEISLSKISYSQSSEKYDAFFFEDLTPHLKSAMALMRYHFIFLFPPMLQSHTKVNMHA